MAKSIAPNTWEKVKATLDQIDVNESGDDKGIIFKEQLSVGAPDNPKESVFGGGDSYPVPIAFHYNTSNETGTTITGATDITTILQSDSGSSVGLFEANVSGEVLLLGSDYPPYGVKMKYTSTGDLTPANVLGQHLDNVDVWHEENYMVTKSDYPYTRRTWEIASFTSEQIRFGLTLLNPSIDVAKRTLNINGVNIEKYWARLILVTPIPTVPTVEQVKIHTSRKENNSDGTVELFGLSRGVKSIILETYGNGLNDPDDEKVVYYTGGLNGASAKMKDNKLKNGKIDSRIYIVKIDDDIDTSSPVLISIPWYVKSSNTGTVEFTIEALQITQDFVYDASVTPDLETTKTFTFASSVENERQLLQFEIPINKIDPTVGGVVITVLRDASASRVADTLAGDVVLAGENGRARRWRL